MISKKSNIVSKDVWSANWQGFNKDEQSILKHTSVTPGFSAESYTQIKSYINNSTQKVLEVGCGTGRFIMQLAKEFPQLHCEGSDISPESIALAQSGAKLRQLDNVLFAVDDMTNPKPKYGEYDLVYNEGSIEHFKGTQDLVILKKLLQFVAPGGTLLFGVPNYRCYVHTFNKFLQGRFYKYGFERSYKKETLEAYLKELSLAECKVFGVGFCHGVKRYGFPYKLWAKKHDTLLKTNPTKAELWNDKYGFFIFASGKK